MPNEWIHSSFVQSVCINPFTDNRSMALENNRLHVFDSETGSAKIVKVSTAPALSGEYSTLSPHQLVVSGASPTIKILDERTLSSNAVWKRIEAHAGIIRDVRFSPLIPHWLASAGDDGTIRVWDTRFNAGEVLRASTYQTIISKIAWAHTHTNILASGGGDNTVKIVYLPAGPQHIVACDHSSLSSHVVGLAATTRLSEQMFAALSSQGELMTATITPDFLEPLVEHRLKKDDPESEQSQGELLIHTRQLHEAFQILKGEVEQLWGQGRVDEALAITKLCTPLSIEDPIFEVPSSGHPGCTAECQHTCQFKKELQQTSYYMPPHLGTRFIDTTEIPLELAQGLENLKLSLELTHGLTTEDPELLFRYKSDLVRAFMNSPQAVGLQLLSDSIRMAQTSDLSRAMDLGIAVCEQLQDEQPQFHELVLSLMAPTVFHGTGPAEYKTEVDTFLAHLTHDHQRLALAMLQLQKDVCAAHSTKSAAEAVGTFSVDSIPGYSQAQIRELTDDFWIRDFWNQVGEPTNAACLLLSQTALKVYLDALSANGQYSQYFACAVWVLERVRGYEFESVIRVWISDQFDGTGRRWAALQKRTLDADTESNIDHLAAVLPEYQTQLHQVIATHSELMRCCADDMLDKEKEAGALVEELGTFISEMAVALKGCLNKILMHTTAKRSAIAFAKGILHMVNAQRLECKGGDDLKTTLETAIALYDVDDVH